ncbi:hypothetical protein TYRP_004499 [Tyrophagus putrescentiae]|nr:hypothetical protein TYRP_004499 [Tyrophagus putrescentiae]
MADRQEQQQQHGQGQQQNGPEQAQPSEVLQRAVEDRVRIICLHHFNVIVQESLIILNEMYYRFLYRSDAFFLSVPTNTLALEIIRLEECKARLMRCLNSNYPGKRCLLVGLINLTTVANYQYSLIMQTARRQRSYFFNWAAVYVRSLHILNPPCRLVHIPPLAFDYNFLCNHMQRDDYLLLIRYFICHLMYCQENTCCGRHPLLHG